jgi:trans-feruloyl-CoA hydratase/vanillin synthase
MGYATLLIEKSDGVALLSLNRPDKKNAMNPQLHEDMTAAPAWISRKSSMP